MVSQKPDFEVGIIGGGPAGSSMAAYLAKAGVSCVVFEGELFPRPHVGESFVPSSTRVFKDLDFLAKMEEAKFPHKYGAAWTAAGDAPQYQTDWKGLSDNGKDNGNSERDRNEKAPTYTRGWDGLAAADEVDIRFAERDQSGVDQPYTYHVDRGKFDLLLLQHAHELGASVYEGITVKGVELDADPHPRVNFTMNTKPMDLSVRMVVDASGRRTLMGKQLKWRIHDPVFDQYAIHTWFEGYDRTAVAADKSLRDYIFIHFLPITNTWIWQIPITDDVTSIGVVTQKKNFKGSREDREKFFWSCIRTRPDLYEALKASNQVRPLKDEGDYSYAMRQIAGDKLVLVGDAARFVDPIFSTGVSIALNSSRFASRDIIAALDTGDVSRQAFTTFETTIKRGVRNWYRFISVYYRLNVLFTAFINDKRYRLDVLKLLQGDVYDEDEPEVLTRMREIVSKVERNPKHVWHDLLGELTADAFVNTF